MSKTLDLDKSVSTLCKENPELKEVLAGIGFTEITNPAALATVGKFMTIPKGAMVKGFDLAKVIKELEAKGYEVTGSNLPKEEASDGSAGGSGAAGFGADNGSAQDGAASETLTADERSQLLKSYVKRLNDGEDLESVREDFRKHFSNVEAIEIMRAEQELMASGMEPAKVQKLCDVHSALFHGATRQEQIANAERAVNESLMRENQKAGVETGRDARDDAKVAAEKLEQEEGHPLQVLTLENNAIQKQINVLRAMLEANASVEELLPQVQKIRAISSHYGKKGDLIYPLLKTKYDIAGPSNVMWGVDDEIRDAYRDLYNQKTKDEAKWKDILSKTLTRTEEMIFKEQNILFPICVQYFTEEQWIHMSRDFKGYDLCLIEPVPEWKKAAEAETGKAGQGETAQAMDAAEGEIVLPTGHMTLKQLTAVLNTIPMELTFVDHKDFNRYFNDGEKMFKRPSMALDREVYTCHPPKVEPIVRQIISDFKSGKKDSVEVWNNKSADPMFIRYLAVRDKEGNYIGTLECVENMKAARDHFAKDSAQDSRH